MRFIGLVRAWMRFNVVRKAAGVPTGAGAGPAFRFRNGGRARKMIHRPLGHAYLG